MCFIFIYYMALVVLSLSMQGIWKTEDETEGSLTSVQSLDEAYEAKFMRRDPSLDR